MRDGSPFILTVASYVCDEDSVRVDHELSNQTVANFFFLLVPTRVGALASFPKDRHPYWVHGTEVCAQRVRPVVMRL